MWCGAFARLNGGVICFVVNQEKRKRGKRTNDCAKKKQAMKVLFVLAAVALLAAADWDDEDRCGFVEDIDELHHNADLTYFRAVHSIPVQNGNSLIHFSLCRNVYPIYCPAGSAVCYDPGMSSVVRSLGKLENKHISVSDGGKTVTYTFTGGSTCQDSQSKGQTIINFHHSQRGSKNCYFRSYDACELVCDIDHEYLSFSS